MNIRGAYGTKNALTSPKTFGERLRCIRMAWGWSQKRLAETLGSNQRLVSHWERDIAKPSGAAMTAISSLLEISTEALLNGKGFTIPDMPALVEGVPKETVAQYAVLSRSLPKPKKGRIALVNIDAFESKPLTLDEAVRVLKATKGTDAEVWVVVRAGHGPKG
ncbi:MAG: helix-turn-helix transcriptional regulator [Holophaga sp.]|jgi:transcriptional regulator with XRE-family HTH domain